MPTLVRRISVPLAPAWQPCSAPPSVLLVTDDGDLRAAAARVLGSAGYAVTAAAHSGHAILASLQSNFDVLLIEQRLAEGSSRSIAGRIQRYNPEIRIIRFCGKATAVRNATDVVRPFTADDLFAALRVVVPTASAAS